MQTKFDGCIFEAFFEDVAIGDYGLASEGFLEPFGRDGLYAWVDDREQQRCLNYAALGFKFANSSKQIFFFNLKAQSET